MKRALAGLLLVAAGAAGCSSSPRYAHDHALIHQLTTANDSMRASCGGWAALEMKADGSTEVIGHCPGRSR